jgi:hypothetical protein
VTDLQFGLGASGVALAALGAVLASRQGQRDPKIGPVAGVTMVVSTMVWYVGMLALYSNRMSAVYSPITYEQFAIASLIGSLMCLGSFTAFWSILFSILSWIGRQIVRFQEHRQRIEAVH